MSIFLEIEKLLDFGEKKGLIEKWDKIFAIKEDVAKDLEEARATKVIGHSLDALITINTNGDEFKFMQENLQNLKLITIVSQFEIVESAEKSIVVEKSYGDKCVRCWTYSPDVGRHQVHRLLCKKCIDNM